MNSSNNFQGKAIIISAPSGAGKTTLVNKLLEAKLLCYFPFLPVVELLER